MLYLKIPFYGKRGSIAEIKESDKTYDLSTYDIDGKINNYISKIKKTYENKNAILNNFYEDTYEYLKMYKDKYDNASYKKNINFPSTKIIENIFIASGVLTISAIPVALLTDIYGIIGYSLAIGVPFLVASYTVLNKIDKQNKRKRFVNEYAELNNIYRNYENYKNQKDKIKAREITPVNRNKELTYKYVRELTK